MEWKSLGVIAAVMLLLVSPIAFARDGGSNSGSGKLLSVSSITGAMVQLDDDDGTADQGSGGVAVDANSAVAANMCPTKSTIKVDCSTLDQTPGSAREWRGADGCKYECAEGDDIDVTAATSAAGAVAISAEDESSSSTSSDGFVKIAIAASPQEAQVGDTIKVAGTVGFDSPSAAVALEKKFKVEIKMTGMDGDFSGMAGTILFESSDDGTQKPGRGGDDIISATVRAVASVFGSTDDSVDDGTVQEDRNTAGESSDDSRRGGSSAGVVSAVTASNSGSASQEVTEYIVLRNGESKDVVAYFKARTPGMKIVKMEVYESVGFDCPTATAAGATDPAATSAAPCREGFRKVAEASTKVRVSGSPIPVPPEPPLPVNNSTGSVASSVIYLYSGWNMVSVPVMAKVSMQEAQQECGSQEFAWRLTEGGYVKERTLVPGYGYWIKAGNDCKIEVGADSYTRELAQLFSGWNLVGAPGQDVQFADYKGNCDITAGPWYYQNPSTATAANPYVLSSTLSPGKAYWIKVPSSCSLGPTEEQPPVPPS